MRTFIKPLTAAAGAGALALSISAAPALAAPANPNGLSPAVTVTTAASPAEAYSTGLRVQIQDGDDTAIRPDTQWSCGLLRMDGWIKNPAAKDNRYRASWKVAVGASYHLPALTITLPAASSTGIEWTIPEATPGLGTPADEEDATDLAPGNDKPEFIPMPNQDTRVDVVIDNGEVRIEVPGGVQAGEYFNVELDATLSNETATPTTGSEFVNSLVVDQVCSTPDAPTPAVLGASAENGEGGQLGGPGDAKKYPVKVNSGGENDGTSGLIALALGAVVVTGAATYGLRRSKN